MARPPAGSPPVQPSAVSRREDKPELVKYADLVKAFDDPRRHSDLLAMLGSEDSLQRFMSVSLHAVATNSDLLRRATLPSLIQAVKDSAALGLEPTGLTGEAWIILYGDTATLIPGWRGYVKRVRNSGMVQDIDCQVVYMNDVFDLEFGTNPSIRHIPKLVGEKDDEGKPTADRGDFRGAYAWARMPSGTYIIDWMTTDDIQYIAQTFSQSVRSGRASPWTTSWSEMARKTVMKRLAKRLPQSAVDQLLALDARAEQLEAETGGPNGAGRIDVSRARRAAIAAVAGKGAIPILDQPDQTASPSVPHAPEPSETTTLSPMRGAIHEPTELQDDDLAPFDNE